MNSSKQARAEKIAKHKLLMSTDPKYRRKIYTGRTFAVLAVVFMIVVFSLGSKESSKSNAPLKSHKSMAQVIASKSVIQKLKFPEEADFDLLSNNVTERTDSTFLVKGNVTSKNAFGVKAKLLYECELKFLGGDDVDPNSWEIKSCNLYE